MSLIPVKSQKIPIFGTFFVINILYFKSLTFKTKPDISKLFKLLTTCMRHIIAIKRHDMTKHGRVLAILSVPRLTPIKLELEMLGQILLQVVMHTLYEHGLEAHLLEQIGHGGRIAERVN